MVTESLYSSIWVPVCGWEKGKEETMQEKQRVSDMAVEVLTRQASGHAKRTGELLEDALKAVLDTEAGQPAWGAARRTTARRECTAVAGGSTAEESRGA
jgi:hypothetical protein